MTTFANDSAWKPVQIGAGGYLTGMDVAPDGTMVARTDTYGAYIWTGTGWTQLVTSNSMPANVQFSSGVYEIRVSASNSSVMYMEMADGIYKTSDRGQHWLKTSFPSLTIDPNGNNRMDGQKMAIDPSNPNIVFAGTQHDGLWVTRDGGTSWQNVAAVPQGPSTDDPALTGIVIQGSNVFVGTAGSGVYASHDGGYTWSAIGGPADLVSAVSSPDGSYWAADNTGLWKYTNGTWIKSLDDSHSGVHSISIDPFNAAHIIVTIGSGNIQESNDGGATWSGQNWYNQLESGSDVPWLQSTNRYMGNGGTVFDPLVQGKLWQSAGVGMWETQLPSTFTWQTPVVWHSQSMGIEQLVANTILAPAGDDPIFGSWDRAFFQMSNLDSYAKSYSGGDFSMGWALDYASTDPKFVVGISDWWGTENSGFSADGGKTWQKFAGYPSFAGQAIGGSIAASSPTNILWAPANGYAPAYTLDGGATWKTINIPGITDWKAFDFAYYLERTTITADRVLPNTFYLYDVSSGVYRSTDGGVNWTKMFSGEVSIFSGANAKIEAVPGSAGELFFTSGPQGSDSTKVPGLINFMHSIDGGATWQAVNGVQVSTFGYGAAATAGGPATVCIVGTVNGKYGIWYSADDAHTWTQIGDHPMGSLDNIKTISGDMGHYGKVYVGFAGSGYAYLDFASASASAPAQAPAPTSTLVLTPPSQSDVITDALVNVGTAKTVGNGALVNDPTPTLHGTVSGPLAIGQTVSVYRDGLKLGIASLSSTGWGFTDPGASNGGHNYSARVEDATGGTGTFSANFGLVIDTVAPTQQVAINTAIDHSGLNTYSLASGATADDHSPVINGLLSATLGSDEQLIVSRDGVSLGAATVSGTQWSFADANVADGSHSYTAMIMDAAGNAGLISNSFILSVQSLRFISGTVSNDVLTGSPLADRISGLPDTGTFLGKGTIDVLTGGGGADIFVLGDSRGRFYDDANFRSAGTRDYALITDFAADDKLQLKGNASSYFQSWRTVDGHSGTGIFYDSNHNGLLDSRDELIALVQNHGHIDPSGMIFV